MRRLGERRVHVAELDLVGRDHVRGGLAPHRRAVLRGPHVGREGQGLVVHHHQRGRVLGDVTVVRHDNRHRLADIAGFAGRERERPALVERHAGIGMPHHAAVDHHGGKVVQRQHRVHAGQSQRRVLVDAVDQGVRMRAAHEGRMPGPRHGDVVDEAALAAQEWFVFQAGDAGTNDLRQDELFPSSCPALCRVSTPTTLKAWMHRNPAKPGSVKYGLPQVG
jgi:hypothetical protein